MHKINGNKYFENFVGKMKEAILKPIQDASFLKLPSHSCYSLELKISCYLCFWVGFPQNLDFVITVLRQPDEMLRLVKGVLKSPNKIQYLKHQKF